jgi:NADPH:quinone reductase-like Zn-dependent oxidoreductase
VNLVNALALIANPAGTCSPAESSSPRLALFPPNAEASDRRSSESGRVKLTLTRRVYTTTCETESVRAITQRTLGGPDVLELTDLPQPEPAPTEVLVHVVAAGVNPVDWKVRARGGFLGEPPFTVGWDVAGTVEALGGGVTRFAVGDRVFGMPRFPKAARAYAEYVTSPSRQLARTPEVLSDVEAAALPLAGLTAWQALVETADVQPGQRVLVLGAAGGVGHLAVQIAKARGAHVIGTARSAKHDFLAELGVDEAIDYTSQPVEDAVGDVDVVLDLVGSEETARALGTLRPGGLFIVVPSAAGLDTLREAAGDRVRVTGILVEPDRAGLEAIAGLVETGELRPHIAQTFPLEEAGRAHEAGETGRTQGKLVLTIP